MKFKTPLIKATILKRYKRFLSDIQLPSGETICAHVPNTGRMTGCWGENWSVYLSESDNPKRKLKYTLELTDNGETLIGVNTSITNKIAMEALTNKLIPELAEFDNIIPEQKILDSRIDFYLTTKDEEKSAYLEVKNVTLVENKVALFPDAVSTRGQKHLSDLMEIKKMGHRAIMLYVVNREDADIFKPAEQVDPIYAKLLKEASQNGVEIFVYACKLSPQEITLIRKLEINL